MKYHHHTVGSIDINQKRVPHIRLSGQWLDRHGFRPGCKFTVYELTGCLILSLVKPEEEEKQIR